MTSLPSRDWSVKWPPAFGRKRRLRSWRTRPRRSPCTQAPTTSLSHFRSTGFPLHLLMFWARRRTSTTRSRCRPTCEYASRWRRNRECRSARPRQIAATGFVLRPPQSSRLLTLSPKLSGRSAKLRNAKQKTARSKRKQRVLRLSRRRLAWLRERPKGLQQKRKLRASPPKKKQHASPLRKKLRASPPKKKPLGSPLRKRPLGLPLRKKLRA